MKKLRCSPKLLTETLIIKAKGLFVLMFLENGEIVTPYIFASTVVFYISIMYVQLCVNFSY